MMYSFLDLFFIVFHSGLIVFNLLGWIWVKTRRLHLFSLLATAFSWTVLGIWYGFGYCPCTHWHWLVRRELGYVDMPASYIKFLVDTLLGVQVPAHLVDTLTVVLFLGALGISAYLNWGSGRQEA